MTRCRTLPKEHPTSNRVRNPKESFFLDHPVVSQHPRLAPKTGTLSVYSSDLREAIHRRTEARRLLLLPDRLSGLEYLSRGLVTLNSHAFQSNEARRYADCSVAHGASSVRTSPRDTQTLSKAIPLTDSRGQPTRRSIHPEANPSVNPRARRLIDPTMERGPAKVIAREEYRIVPHGEDESSSFADCAFNDRSFEDLATSDLGSFPTRSGANPFEFTPCRVVGTTRCVTAPDDLVESHEAGSCVLRDVRPDQASSTFVSVCLAACPDLAIETFRATTLSSLLQIGRAHV